MHLGKLIAAACTAIVLTAGLGVAASATAADVAASTSPVSFNIKPQPLASALNAFAVQSHQQILFTPEIATGKSSRGVTGALAPSAALAKLLSGTGLASSRSADGMILVTLADAKEASAKSDPPFAPNGAGSSPRTNIQVQEPLKTASLEEIIVTAQKRAERLQDVSLSVTAMGAEELRQSGVQSIADIAREVPGLNVVSSGPGQNQLIIRGVSSGSGVPTATVGYYIDDTPIQSAGSIAGAAMDPALFDLDRVEVLRGPQGTLYGASSMGGTVRYITHQPNLKTTEGWAEANPSATQSGGFNYSVSGLINQPIIDNVAAIRAVVFYRDQDGYIDRYPIDPTNILLAGAGPVARHVNTEKTYGTRISGQFSPSEALSITPSIFIQRMNLGGPFTFDSPPGSFDHPIQTRDSREPITDRVELYSLTIKGQIAGVDVTSSTSYRDRQFDAVEDESRGNFAFLSPVPQSVVYPTSFDNTFANHDFTEEIRASGSWGRVHALAGAFYLHQDNHFIYSWPITAGYNAAFGTPFGSEPYFYGGTDSNQTTDKALFGEMSVDVTSALQATAGLRLFDIRQHDHAIYTGLFNGGTSDGRASSKDTGTNPKVSFSYRFSADVLTYLSATKGFRQGGPQPGIPALCAQDFQNLGISSAPTSFSADSLWSYELGAKTAWLDRRLTVNSAVYYIDWSKVQQLVPLPLCGYSFTANSGRASSKGAELEIRYEPTSALRLSLGASFNDAKLLSSNPGSGAQPGDTLENSPRWAGSASIEYHRPLGATTAGYLRAGMNATSEQFNSFDPTNIYYRRAGYSLAALRAGVTHAGWDAALYVSNALNKRAETALPPPYGFTLPTTRSVALNQPRTVGAEVRYEF